MTIERGSLYPPLSWTIHYPNGTLNAPMDGTYGRRVPTGQCRALPSADGLAGRPSISRDGENTRRRWRGLLSTTTPYVLRLGLPPSVGMSSGGRGASDLPWCG